MRSTPTPGDTHAEIAIAALRAGKHVLCEKPLANTVAEAEAMAAAAADAAGRGVFASCGFTYRRTPALALARQLVEQGRIGQVRHVRAVYLQDWLNDPTAPMTWRLDKGKAGSGALGDIGAHLIDTAQWLTGSPFTGVSGLLETFTRNRPLGGARVGLGGQGATGGDAPYGSVTVDDAALFTARFADGALGSFEASRCALGRKNAMRIEINGTDGSLGVRLRGQQPAALLRRHGPGRMQGFRRIVVTEPDHPYVAAWWPPGHGLGYDHGFVHQAVDLVRAIGERRQPEPSFADALGVQRVLAAVERSAADDSRWTPVQPSG